MHGGLADVAQAVGNSVRLGGQTPNIARFTEATSAWNDPTLPLEGLSPVNGKAIVARFDGGKPVIG